MPVKTISLIDLKEGQKGIVVSVLGGYGVIQRLSDMGLTPGTEFEILRKGRLCPVEISIRGSKLVIGCGIATKILVKAKK